MSVRSFEITLGLNFAKPAAINNVGVQGEHNATELKFTLEKEVRENIAAAVTSLGGTLYYRFDGYDGAGSKASTEPVAIKTTALSDVFAFKLENWITQNGININVCLVFTLINSAGNENVTEMELYSGAVKLQLRSMPSGEDKDGVNMESLTTLSVAAREYAEQAATSQKAAYSSQLEAEESEAACKEAEEKTLQARLALEDGAVWIFDGGTATVTIPDVLSGTGNQTIKNGSLTLEDTNNNGLSFFNQKRTIGGTEHQLRCYVNASGYGAVRKVIADKSGNTTLVNQMVLADDTTTFSKPVALGSGGTGATTAAEAREKLGVLGNSGNQEIKNGKLIINDTDNSGDSSLCLDRTIDGVKYRGEAYTYSDGRVVLRGSKDGNEFNRISLAEDKTIFTQPIAFNGDDVEGEKKQSRKNLGMAAAITNAAVGTLASHNVYDEITLDNGLTFGFGQANLNPLFDVNDSTSGFAVATDILVNFGEDSYFSKVHSVHLTIQQKSYSISAQVQEMFESAGIGVGGMYVRFTLPGFTLPALSDGVSRNIYLYYQIVGVKA